LSGTGFGIYNYGALNIRENANLTGAITLTANTLITHDWNVATISGSITGTNINLELKTLQAGQYGFYMNGPISLGTGALTLTGIGTSGSADFNFSGTNSYTGGTLLKGGRVSFNNASAFGSGTVTFVSDTSLASTASMTHANALTVNSGVAATLDVAASTTLDQAGAVTGAGSFTKGGLGTVTLSGGTSNTLSGPITVNAGMLGSLNSASLQNITGAITVAPGATFDAKANFGGNITNNFTLSGTGSGINNYGALNIRENANLTGAITLAADTKITHDWNIAYVNASITGTNTNLELQTLQAGQYGFYMNGPISLGSGSLTLTGIGTSGSPDLTLSGTNSWGAMFIEKGVVYFSNSAAMGGTGARRCSNFNPSLTGEHSFHRSHLLFLLFDR
jgi:autotransporter-associated beta strand protein